MLEFLSSAFWLIVALGLLVTFHEFGHYWVARRAGVRVLRFSVGFGRPLWRRMSRDGVEFVVAAIPLGGYVRMLDERESPVPPEQRNQAFNGKSIGARTAIVLAGPVFNLIFAVAAFWVMFMIGIPDTRPVLGPTSGLAAEAGLESGDMIVEVDSEPVRTWTHAVLELIPASLDRRAVDVRVESERGRQRTLRLALDRLETFDEEQALAALGMRPWQPDLAPVIGRVEPDSPAERADLRAGDRIVAIDGKPVDGWVELVERIGDGGTEGRTISMALERDGTRQEVALAPDTTSGRPLIGIRPPEPDAAAEAAWERTFVVLRHGPVEAFGQAVGETWRLSAATLGMLGRMVTGSASLSNLSGPVTIARMANQSARLGIARFLFFLGLISLSLAIINLLPIPVLDGGQLVYLLIEWIKGSPLSERGLAVGQGLGLLMIAALMSVALFNDFLRLVQ